MKTFAIMPDSIFHEGVFEAIIQSRTELLMANIKPVEVVIDSLLIHPKYRAAEDFRLFGLPVRLVLDEPEACYVRGASLT